MHFMTGQRVLSRIQRAAAFGIVILAVVAFTADSAWAVKIATYNLLNYSSGRTTEFKTILNVMQADVLVAQELTGQTAVNYFLTNVLNATDGPGGYAAATFQLTPGDTGNALFYRTATITYAGPSDHIVLSTSPRYTDRWKLGMVGGSVSFYVYSMHLKAGDTTPDADSRTVQCTAVRTNTNALPAGTAFILCGDFNLYNSAEAAYQQLIGSQSNNNGRAFDPINTPGAWHSDYSYRTIHTQSPCLGTDPNNPCVSGATGGGMDDRFDFVLISSALQDDQGLDYVSGSYKAFGNDGQHFNMDINALPVIPEGTAVANALHSAADHLPVALELTAPPLLTVPGSLFFGTIIVGASSPDNEKTLHVQNGAVPPALDLTYTFTTVPSGFSVAGGTGPFTLSPGTGRDHTIAVSTDTAGHPQGSLIITNNATSPYPVTLFGTVKAHAVPSTDGTSQVLTAPLDFGNHAIGGFTDQTAQLYNQGYTNLQSLLQVYAYSITGQDSARFSLASFAPTNVTTTPAAFTVHFDDTSATAGLYTAALTFSTRDDTTLPGWTNRSDITFNLSASIGVRGDMNGIGGVDSDDIPDFITVLLDPASATASQRWLADMNGDGVNDGNDCQLFVNALLGL